MSIAERVIGKLGGEAAVAEMADVHVSRVYRWRYPKERGGTGGLIPTQHQQRLLDIARERGIDLSPSDFFEAEHQLNSLATMQTVDAILDDVYGDKANAAIALKAKRNAPWNWRKWGHFPHRIAIQIAADAKEKGLDLPIEEIPVLDNKFAVSPHTRAS